METRAITDSMMSHSSDDRSMMDRSSSKDHSDHSKTAAAATATSDGHSSSHTSGHSSSTASGSSGSVSPSSGMAMATAIPMIGAAAMAGIAFAL